MNAETARTRHRDRLADVTVRFWNPTVSVEIQHGDQAHDHLPELLHSSRTDSLWRWSVMTTSTTAAKPRVIISGPPRAVNYAIVWVVNPSGNVLPWEENLQFSLNAILYRCCNTDHFCPGKWFAFLSIPAPLSTRVEWVRRTYLPVGGAVTAQWASMHAG